MDEQRDLLVERVTCRAYLEPFDTPCGLGYSVSVAGLEGVELGRVCQAANHTGVWVGLMDTCDGPLVVTSGSLVGCAQWMVRAYFNASPLAKEEGSS